MLTFDYEFTVQAPLQAIADFHHDTRVLKRLTPPPILMQLHRFEPLGENSKAEFTMWVGPLPLRWVAVHNNVSVNGFTDSQVRGPFAHWQHRHRFEALDPNTTLIREHIEYEYQANWRGLLSRLLFNSFNLTMLFTARKFITRWHLRRM